MSTAQNTAFNGGKENCAQNKGQPHHKASQSTEPNHASTNTEAQRTRLLDALMQAQGRGVSTVEARHELNIMQPAARVIELKDRGYFIKTVRAAVYDEHGRRHTGVARYVLTGMPEVAAHG